MYTGRLCKRHCSNEYFGDHALVSMYTFLCFQLTVTVLAAQGYPMWPIMILRAGNLSATVLM